MCVKPSIKPVKFSSKLSVKFNLFSYPVLTLANGYCTYTSAVKTRHYTLRLQNMRCSRFNEHSQERSSSFGVLIVWQWILPSDRGWVEGSPTKRTVMKRQYYKQSRLLAHTNNACYVPKRFIFANKTKTVRTNTPILLTKQLQLRIKQNGKLCRKDRPLKNVTIRVYIQFAIGVCVPA